MAHKRPCGTEGVKHFSRREKQTTSVAIGALRVEYSSYA